jgi:phage shock protein PspC (stress-responsive transcriptional regulator)
MNKEASRTYVSVEAAAVRHSPRPRVRGREREVLMSESLHRSRSDRILGGVCGGLAAWLGWGPTKVRLLYVLVSVLSAGFPGALVYVLLWLIMPLERRVHA